MDSDPAGGHECPSLASVVCCPVEVSATGRSVVQRGPTDCGVPECDLEMSKMRRPWPTRRCCARKNVTLQKIVTAECLVGLISSFGLFE